MKSDQSQQHHADVDKQIRRRNPDFAPHFIPPCPCLQFVWGAVMPFCVSTDPDCSGAAALINATQNQCRAKVGGLNRGLNGPFRLVSLQAGPIHVRGQRKSQATHRGSSETRYPVAPAIRTFQPSEHRQEDRIVHQKLGTLFFVFTTLRGYTFG